MQLTLDSLKTTGGFVGGPVKRTVEWEHNGETVSVEAWFRPMSYFTAAKELPEGSTWLDETAARLAGHVCNEDGSPVFRVCDITGVNPDGSPLMVKDENGKKVERGSLTVNLLTALSETLAEVSGLGKTKGNSPKKKSSGMS